MNGNSFFDTNVLIYFYTATELEKRRKILPLVNKSATISLQVIHEFSNVLQKKFKQDEQKITEAIEELEQSFTIYQNTLSSVKSALKISSKYHYSFFDALIIAAALDADCAVIYSEDMHHNQTIEKRLKILNPFV